tara:strand:- start:517 stop:747 length:231 start_codon:yes stop_codon:yes gene_type:complete
MQLSECCGAIVYDDTDICSKCLEHCDIYDDEIDYEEVEKEADARNVTMETVIQDWKNGSKYKWLPSPKGYILNNKK